MTNQLFYFKISQDSLEVKNFVMPWYSKVFLFIDIDLVNIEPSGSGRSRALSIKTIDFGTHNYGAGSLRTKDWNALAHALKARNVPTRNRI